MAHSVVRHGDRHGDRGHPSAFRVARRRGPSRCARGPRGRRRGRRRRPSSARGLAADRPCLDTGGRQARPWKGPVDPSAAAPSSSARSVMATSSYARDRAAQQELAIAIVLGTVMVLGSAVIAISWSLPMIAAWVHSGRVAHLGVLDALKALVNGRLYGGEPASAYPVATGRLLPGAWGFWSVAALSLIGLTAGAGGGRPARGDRDEPPDRGSPVVAAARPPTARVRALPHGPPAGRAGALSRARDRRSDRASLGAGRDRGGQADGGDRRAAGRQDLGADHPRGARASRDRCR